MHPAVTNMLLFLLLLHHQRSCTMGSCFESSQATSLDELMSRIREAIEMCLDVEGELTEELEFVGVRRIRLTT